MKTAKLGAIFLISIMALAGVGAGYAAWTDTIYIQGTVNTGSVGWDIVDYSGTWVYKVPEGIPGANPDYGNEINVRYISYTNPNFKPIYPTGWIPIASAYAIQTQSDAGPVDDSVTVVFDNLFPCIDFEADFTVHYTGSVPGKINDITWRDAWPEDTDELYPTDPEEWIDYFTTLEITIGKLGADGEYHWTPISIDELYGYQLHKCNKIHIVMKIYLPQYYDDDGDSGTPEVPTDFLMNLNGGFDLDVEVIQWNEFDGD